MIASSANISADTETKIDKTLNSYGEAALPPLRGLSNGVRFSNGFFYIQAVVDQEGLKYDAFILNLDGSASEPAKRVPVILEGYQNEWEIDSGKDIKEVEITMKASVRIPNVVAVKITVHKEREVFDSLSIATIDEKKILADPEITLQKIKGKNRRVCEFEWHPQSQLTLQILWGCETFEVWNIIEQNFMCPTNRIDLKKTKKKFSLHAEIKFCSFATSRNTPQGDNSSPALLANNYTLFLMTSLGDVCSIFPYLPEGTVISQSQLERIQTAATCAEQEILSEYLDLCEIADNDDGKFLIIKSDLLDERTTYFGNWERAGQYVPINQSVIKSKKVHEDQLTIIPLTDICSLFVTSRKKTESTSSLCLLLATQQITVENGSITSYQLNPIRQIDTRAGFAITILRLPSAPKQMLFFAQGNSVFKIDCKAAFDFARTNNLSFLAQKEAFSVSLVLKGQPKQQINCLSFDENLANVYLVVTAEKKRNFRVHSLNLMGFFDQFKSLFLYSNSFLQKIKDYKAEKNANTNPDPSTLNASQIKNTQSFKEEYTKHCSALKKWLDDSMGELKKVTEIAKQKVTYLDQQKRNKERLESLLSQVQKNDAIINGMLFSDSQSIKNSNDPELKNASQKSERIHKLLNKASSMNVELDAKSRDKMDSEAKELLIQLEGLTGKLLQAKKWKKIVGKA